MRGATRVGRTMRYLTLVIMLCASWTAAGFPQSFVADSSISRSAPALSSPTGAKKKLIPAGSKFPAGKPLPFAPLGGKSVISPTPDDLDDIHSGDTIDTKSNTHGYTPHLSCADSAWVLLRPVFPADPLSASGRLLRVPIHYGKLSLGFTSAPKTDGSWCTLVSQRGALPIIADVKTDPGIASPTVMASQQIAASVTTATLDFISTRMDIHRCDLSIMQSLGHADLADPTTPLPSGSNNCYLNARSCDVINGISVRWSIPGFEQYVPNEQGIRVYKTQALTYYVDLNSFLMSNDVRSINPAAINYLENYIHRTLIRNLPPALTPIGIAQIWPAV
jgi:hypothetical protein